MGAPYFSRGLIHCGVRWKTNTCSASAAMGARSCTPVEPLPMIATRLPVRSMSGDQPVG